MAYSFYASMGLTHKNWTLVASTTNDYVAFAAKLANDVEHRRAVAAAVAARQHVTWEDRSVVLGWARFLERVSGQRPVAPADIGLEGDDYEAEDEAPVALADVGLVEEDESAEARAAHERLDRRSGTTQLLRRSGAPCNHKSRSQTCQGSARTSRGRPRPSRPLYCMSEVI